MNAKNTLLTLIITLFLIGCNYNPNTKHIQGLEKVPGELLETLEIDFGDQAMSIYNTEGKKINVDELMQTLMSGNYIQDFYMDKNKNIKASVLRLLTEEQKKQNEKENEMEEDRLDEMDDELDSQNELIGEDAFPFSATDINGKSYSLKSLKGKIIVMNFWFIECKPCVTEMPELNRIVEEYKNEEIVFLGFARNNSASINSFLKENKFSYNIIPNSKNTITDYKVSGYPTHIIIDKDSKISYLTSGLGDTTISNIEKNIELQLEK